jgi:MoxR-like ATPase
MTDAAQTAPPIQQDIDTVTAIKRELRTTLVERDPEIDLIILSLLGQVHGLIVGAPGAAKSMTVREVVSRITFPDPDTSYYEVLFRKSLPVEQLVGPVSLQGLTQDVFRYITTGKLPEANVAFLDEIWKANAVVLNAMLTILNERIFHNNGHTMPVPLWAAIGASNELPTETELMAIRDRFGWCKITTQVKTDDGFKSILRGQVERNAGTAVAASKTTITPEAIGRLQAAAKAVTVPDDVLADLAQLRRKAEGEANLFVSPRRYGEGIKLAQAAALLTGRDFVTPDDLTLYKHVLWTDEEDIATADKLVLEAFASKVAKAAADLRSSFEPLQQTLAGARAEAQANGGNISKEAIDTLSNLAVNLRKVRQRTEAEIADAQASNRDHAELDLILRDVVGAMDVVRNEIMG